MLHFPVTVSMDLHKWDGSSFCMSNFTPRPADVDLTFSRSLQVTFIEDLLAPFHMVLELGHHSASVVPCRGSGEDLSS